MNQGRNRDQAMPNRQSDTEEAKGSRETGSERGDGDSRERNRADSQPSHSPNSGGITNRPLDRERCEQEQRPERGQSQPEH